jgi:cytochrome c biogenesis protein CcmG/thiol:disulfide interchange protein DsbE
VNAESEARHFQGTRTRAFSILLLLCALAVHACVKQPAWPIGNSGWTTIENQHARLSDYKGKIVVLDFYATWCQPCRAETPHLVAMQQRYGAQGLQIIGLNVGGEEDQAQVPDYAKQFGIQYPLGLPDDDLVQTYLSDNENIPQTYVFDRNGEIVRRFVGYSEVSGQELERIVQSALQARSAAAGE